MLKGSFVDRLNKTKNYMSVISSFSVVYRIGWRNAEYYSEIVEISSEPV